MTWPWKKRPTPPCIVESWMMFAVPMTEPGTAWDGYTFWYRIEVT